MTVVCLKKETASVLVSDALKDTEGAKREWKVRDAAALQSVLLSAGVLLQFYI